MKRLILAAAVSAIAGSAFALPNGKPFQELAAEINKVQTDIELIRTAISDGDAALQEQINQIAETIYAAGGLKDQLAELRTDTDANSTQIATLESELAGLQSDIDTAVGNLSADIGINADAIQQLADNLAAEVAARIAADNTLLDQLAVLDQIVATGDCGDGTFVTSVETDGTINCASALVSGPDADYIWIGVRTPVFTMQPGGFQVFSTTCPEGTHHIDGGYITNNLLTTYLAELTGDFPEYVLRYTESDGIYFDLEDVFYRERNYRFSNQFDQVVTQGASLWAICKSLPGGQSDTGGDGGESDSGEAGGDGTVSGDGGPISGER